VPARPVIGPTLFHAGRPALRCVFGQNAAGYQMIGLLMIAAAIAVLVFVAAPVARVLAWGAIPVGLFAYVIMGHAPIYGWFLWWHALRHGDPKA